MDDLIIFENINKEDIDKMLKCFEAKRITFSKDRTIISNMTNAKSIGIILSGRADMIRYEYNGNRTILEKLMRNSIFGEVFSYLLSGVSVVATTNCEVLFIDYDHLIKRCKKGCICHSILVDNVLQLLSKKIIELNERIEILSKRTIREKLLSYFNLMSKDKINRTFSIQFSYTDLADYLSIDRSAMMREIKCLRDDGFIHTDGRKIRIITY